MITTKQLAQAIINACYHHPQGEQPCEQIQAFRLLAMPNATEVSLPSFGATDANLKDGSAWFRSGKSTKQNLSAFPAVFLTELERTGAGVFGKQSKVTTTYELSVMDAVTSDCPGGCKGCAARGEIAVESGCADILAYLMAYLGNCVLADVKQGDIHGEYLLHQLSISPVTDTVIEEWGYIFQQMTANRQVNIPSVWYSAMNLYGVSVQFSTTSNLCQSVKSPDMSGGILLFQEGCC